MPTRAKDQQEIEDRFWAKVDKTSTCWLWTGAKNRIGYGSVGGWLPERRTFYAHRVSFEMANGPIPEGMCICHRCDIRLCVNPAHLFLGTRRDNNNDTGSKNRNNKNGTKVAKVTPEQVVEIRAAYEAGGVSCNKLAEQYGLKQMAVNNIVNRVTWKWVA